MSFSKFIVTHLKKGKRWIKELALFKSKNIVYFLNKNDNTKVFHVTFITFIILYINYISVID